MFLLQILLPVACYIALVTANAQNRTILFGDSSLDFSVGWLASHEQLSGDLFFTFDQAGVVALKGTLPSNTQRFEYIGLKRTGGSLYGVCLNCDDDDSSILVVNGHDDSLHDDDQATPTTIFSLEVERDRQNTFVLFNLDDGKFNDQNGSITFQSLIVTIDDGIDDGPNSSSSSSDIQTTSSSSTSTPSASSPTSHTSTTGSTSTPSSSPAAVPPPTNSGTRSSIIAIIVVFTVLPIVSLTIGLYFFMRHRARRKSRMSDFFMYNPNPVRRFSSFRASPSR